MLMAVGHDDATTSLRPSTDAMPYLIGTDEAGYGPNLGPLVISVSAWWVPDELLHSNLYEVLQQVVCEKPERTGKAQDKPARIAIADSKRLYKPKGSVATLERGLLSALALLDRRPTDWHDLWTTLAGDSGAPEQNLPWYDGFELAVPWAVKSEALSEAIDLFAHGTAAAGVRLIALRSLAVFPQQFNELCTQLDSKGAALSRLTMELLAEVLDPLDEPAYIVCDKHGGRNRYAALLQEHFPDYLIQIRHEGRAESAYRWGPESRQVAIHFRAGGERFLPAALASMACKYLRELAMLALNEYWSARVENLKPTAGYPVDAKRFKQEIAAAQEELAIADSVLWRAR